MSDAITRAQRGLGDMEPEEFRRSARRTADLVADYLERLPRYPVSPDLEPGAVRSRLPPDPPSAPEPLERILDDYLELIEPNITHWQHPGFMGYFPSVASGPGILGEWLASGLNSNVMFWRNAPASTELEEVVVGWLRRLLGLPEGFDGMFTDTASVSSLLALVAARNAIPGLDSRREGLAGRAGLPRLRLYASAEAHFSIDKAAIVIGAGQAGLRRIEVDDAFRMRGPALAAAIAEDRERGWLPFCVIGTVGTTSSTSVDPPRELAEICEREGLWLHLDAAYGGAAAMLPEKRPLFDGWERADSIVFNPHKWLFTPFDASLLLFRDPEAFRGAFSLVPEYITTGIGDEVHNYNEYGIQMGRRFRALKLWMLIRWFGAQGIVARLREHCRMARELASWIEADDEWELLAPLTFATVCFRHRPAAFRGTLDDARRERLDAANAAILTEINRAGRFYLSHTRLGDAYTLRVSLGNPRATLDDVRRCWQTLVETARRLRLE